MDRLRLPSIFEQTKSLYASRSKFTDFNCISLELKSSLARGADLTKQDSGFALNISNDFFNGIFAFWESFQLLQRDSSNSSFDKELKQYLNLSFRWLILHELSHVDLGHFKLADSFGVAQRSTMKPEPLGRLPTDLRPLAQPCLEMQADHEATEMLLGAYTSNGWEELRSNALAISGMMMLIEREDIKNGLEGRTHPKAATRIFQMLGHLAEMPLVRAQVDQDASLIPSENDLQAFAHEVTIPCFFDAVELANASGAPSIVNDLGSPEDFFKDLEIAKLGDPSRYADLKTQGAQERAKLWPCNESLKPILGSHFTN